MVPTPRPPSNLRKALTGGARESSALLCSARRRTCGIGVRRRDGRLRHPGAFDPVEGNGPNTIAVVGGTRAYEGASGSIRSVPRGPNSNYTDDTVHLILPS